MKYFTKITQDHWVLKNKAHEEIHAFARENDRKILDKTEVRDYIEGFKEEMRRINHAYPRCKEIYLDTHKGHNINKEDWQIYVSGNFRITIFQANNK